MAAWMRERRRFFCPAAGARLVHHAGALSDLSRTLGACPTSERIAGS
jgi:hypothetical protein